MAPIDDASDPLVIQPWIQHISRQLNTLQLNKLNPGRDRWTGLRRQGPNWKVGSTPTGSNKITENVNLQVQAEYRSTNRTGVQIHDGIPNGFASITGATTTPAIRCERRAVVEQSPRLRCAWAALRIQRVVQCTLTRTYPEYARASTSRDRLKQLSDRKPTNRGYNFSFQDG